MALTNCIACELHVTLTQQPTNITYMRQHIHTLELISGKIKIPLFWNCENLIFGKFWEIIIWLFIGLQASKIAKFSIFEVSRAENHNFWILFQPKIWFFVLNRPFEKDCLGFKSLKYFVNFMQLNKLQLLLRGFCNLLTISKLKI